MESPDPANALPLPDASADEAAATVALPAGSELGAPRDGAFVPGETLLGRFKIVRRVGRGGMGEVYEAEDLELGRIALKTIRQNLAGPEMLRQFKQEIQLARKVSGANVCRIYELFTTPSADGREQVAFLTMEFLDGEMLTDRLRRGALDWQQARGIALELCAGLASIHEAGVLHRDLKSRNIMLVERNQKTVAVLTDFGLALPIAAGSGGVAGAADRQAIAGTPEYMAPEQFEGGELTRAADIYAFGVVLYELVTGRQPYAAHTPLAAAVRRGRKPDLARAPQGWREIIFRCLEYDPARRYQSAGEVAAALRRAANPLTRVTHDAALLARRFRLGVLVAAVLVLALASWRTITRLRMHAPPPEAVHWYGLGEAALREATDVKAIHALQAAVDRDPKYAMAHARLAEALSDLDFTAEADHEMLVAQSEAREQRMSARDEKYLAATQATLTRDYAGAVRRYQGLLDSAGGDDRAASLVDLGRAQEKAGDSKDAMQAYQQAAGLAPDTPAPFVHIGILESRIQHEAAAQAAFALAEKVYSEETNQEGLAEVEYQQGYLANEQGKSAEAKQHLEKARTMAQQLKSVQLEIRALTQLSSVAADSSDQKDATEYAQQAIDMANANSLPAWSAEGWVRLGDVYLHSSDAADKAKAEDDFQRALAIAKQSEQRRVEAQANVGLANLSKGNPDQVIAYAQPALDYYKQYGFSEGMVDSAVFLARAQRDKDELGPAMDSAKYLLQVATDARSKPQVALSQDLMASIYMRQQDYPAAAKFFHEALENSTAALRPYEASSYAEALADMGDSAAAEQVRADYSKVRSAADFDSLLITLYSIEGKYGQVFALAQTSPTREEWITAMAVASAHLGRTEAAEAQMATVKPASAADKADWNLAEAEVELLAANPSKAQSSADAALKYFQTIGARESEVKALAVSAAALSSAGAKQDAGRKAKSGLDILHQLQESWSPTDYASFVSRPDMQDATQMLNACRGAQ